MVTIPTSTRIWKLASRRASKAAGCIKHDGTGPVHSIAVHILAGAVQRRVIDAGGVRRPVIVLCVAQLLILRAGGANGRLMARALRSRIIGKRRAACCGLETPIACTTYTKAQNYDERAFQ